MREALRAWSAISIFVLVLATFRVWLPILGFNDEFPQVPLLESLGRVPSVVDLVALVVFLGGWLLIGFSSRKTLGTFCAIFFGAVLIGLNQHRLQPWCYQLLIFAALLALRDSQLSLRLLRVFVVSIYLYSALSKIDFEFLHTVGQQFLSVPLAALGATSSEDPGAAGRMAMAFAIPISEFAIGVGLIFERTRRWAGYAACVLHVGLLYVLGPLGLNHSWGVLLWNVHFIGVVYLLFIQTPADLVSEGVSSGDSERSKERNAEREAFATLLTRPACWLLLPVLLLPAIERLGFWDHWPSWALYAPHSSRVEVEVASTAVDRLPESLQRLVSEQYSGESLESALWVRVPLSKWSLTQLGVPIYPQDRFQAGVADSLAQIVDSPFEIRAHVLGIASRVTGKRESKTLTGTKEISGRIHDRFLLGSQPRGGDLQERASRFE